MAQPPYPIIATRSPRTPRYGLLILGGVVLAGAGVAAILIFRPAGTVPTTTAAETTVAETLVRAPLNASSTPLLARPASVCAACGTVETVSTKGATAYDVRVRMDDGSLRSFTSVTQPQPGAAVRVDGSGFRVVNQGG